MSDSTDPNDPDFKESDQDTKDGETQKSTQPDSHSTANPESLANAEPLANPEPAANPESAANPEPAANPGSTRGPADLLDEATLAPQSPTGSSTPTGSSSPTGSSAGTQVAGHETTGSPALSNTAVTAFPASTPSIQDNTRRDFPPDLRSFGDFELESELGRGGMGVVYRARQKSLGRNVAIKMILAGRFAGENDLRRFHAEATAAARLDHPNIVPVYEVGQHEGQHYFAMGFVEGRSLADWLQRGPFAPELAAGVLRQLAAAIGYAHSQNIVHRDLKPANILISENDSSVSQGLSPRITDFGLAKHVDTPDDLTGTGQILGTPSYMAPEQAGGHSESVGPSADVYALGAVGYAMITGEPPHRGVTAIDTIRQVLQCDPISPRQINSGVPRDLETIVLKCLQKDPKHRYESAGNLAEDLDRYLAGNEIDARPISRLEKAFRWVGRHRLITALAATTLFLLLGASIGGPILAVSQSNLRASAVKSQEEADLARQQAESNSVAAEAARKEAEVAKRRAEQNASSLRKQQEQNRADLYASELPLAWTAWIDGSVERMRGLLLQAPAEYRGWEWDFLWNYADRGTTRLDHHFAAIDDGAFARDGKRAITVDEIGHWAIWSGDGPARPERTREYGFPRLSIVDESSLSRMVNGGFIWVSTDTKRLIYRESKRQNRTIDLVACRIGPGEKNGLWQIIDANSPDGDQEIYVRLLRRVGNGFRVEKSAAIPIAIAPEDYRFAKAGHQLGTLVFVTKKQALIQVDLSKSIQVNETKDANVKLATPVWSRGDFLGDIDAVAVDPQGKLVAVSHNDGQISLLDMTNGRTVRSRSLDGSLISHLAISEDGKYLAASGNQSQISVCDTEDLRRVAVGAPVASDIKSLHFSKDGNQLLVCKKYQAALWDWRLSDPLSAKVESQSLSLQLGSPKLPQIPMSLLSKIPVKEMVPSGIPGTVWILRTDGSVTLYDYRSKTVVRQMRPSGRADSGLGMAFSPKHQEIAVAISDPSVPDENVTIEVWNTLSQTKVRTLETTCNDCSDLAIDSSQQFWIALSNDRDAQSDVESRILVYERQSGRLLRELGKRDPTWNRLVALPESAWVAATSSDGRVAIWDTQNGKQVDEFPTTFLLRNSEISVSPDGKRIASLANDRRIRIWDRSDDSIRILNQDGTKPVQKISFLDNDRIVSVGNDRSIRWWRLDPESEVLRLPFRESIPTALELSGDGQQVLIGLQNSKVIALDRGKPKVNPTFDKESLQEAVTLYDLIEATKNSSDQQSVPGTVKVGKWVVKDDALVVDEYMTIKQGDQDLSMAVTDTGPLSLPPEFEVNVKVATPSPTSFNVSFLNSVVNASAVQFFTAPDPVMMTQGCQSSIQYVTNGPNIRTVTSNPRGGLQKESQLNDVRIHWNRGQIHVEVNGVPTLESRVPDRDLTQIRITALYGGKEVVTFKELKIIASKSQMELVDVAKQMNQWQKETPSRKWIENLVRSKRDWNVGQKEFALQRLSVLDFDTDEMVLSANQFLGEAKPGQPEQDGKKLQIATAIAEEVLATYPLEPSCRLVLAAAAIYQNRNDASVLLDEAMKRMSRKDGYVTPLGWRLKAELAKRSGNAAEAKIYSQRAQRQRRLSKFETDQERIQRLVDAVAVDPNLESEIQKEDEDAADVIEFTSRWLKHWFLHQSFDDVEQDIASEAKLTVRYPKLPTALASQRGTSFSLEGGAFRQHAELVMHGAQDSGVESSIVLDDFQVEKFEDHATVSAKIVEEFEQGYRVWETTARWESQEDPDAPPSDGIESVGKTRKLVAFSIEPIVVQEGFNDEAVSLFDAKGKQQWLKRIQSAAEIKETPLMEMQRLVQMMLPSEAIKTASQLKRSDPSVLSTARGELEMSRLALASGRPAAAADAMSRAYQADPEFGGPVWYRDFLARQQVQAKREYIGRGFSGVIPVSWRKFGDTSNLKAPGEIISGYRTDRSVVLLSRFWMGDQQDSDEFVEQLKMGISSTEVTTTEFVESTIAGYQAISTELTGKGLKAGIGRDATDTSMQKVYFVTRENDIVIIAGSYPGGQSAKDREEFESFLNSLVSGEEREK